MDDAGYYSVHQPSRVLYCIGVMDRNYRFAVVAIVALFLAYFLGPGRYEYINLGMSNDLLRIDRLTGRVQAFDYTNDEWLTMAETRGGR